MSSYTSYVKIWLWTIIGQQNILLFLSKRQFNRDIIRAENQGVELLKEEAIVEWLNLNSINLDKTIFFLRYFA